MVLREVIESLQEKRLKRAARTATGAKRARITQQLLIIEQNRARRDAISKARAEARFKSELRATREQPQFEEQQRQATQQFQLKTIRAKGRLAPQPKKGFLAGFDKFLAGTGVAKGTAPVLRGGGILGGAPASGFSVVGGIAAPAVRGARRRKKVKRRSRTVQQPQSFNLLGGGRSIL